MGLLDYLAQRYPEPTEEDIAKLRAQVAALKSGRNGAGAFGLLGPSDDELARLRQQRGIPQAEAPSAWASIGRGVTDLWEPIKQAYLNMADPAQAAAYRQQRAADEGFYERGMQWANAQPNYVPQRDDFWRAQAQQLPLLVASMIGPEGPQTSLPSTVMGLQATQSLFDVLNTLRKQYGIGE